MERLGVEALKGWGCMAPPQKNLKPLKKYFLRVNHMLTLAKMKINP